MKFVDLQIQFDPLKPKAARPARLILHDEDRIEDFLGEESKKQPENPAYRLSLTHRFESPAQRAAYGVLSQNSETLEMGQAPPRPESLTEALGHPQMKFEKFLERTLSNGEALLRAHDSFDRNRLVQIL